MESFRIPVIWSLLIIRMLLCAWPAEAATEYPMRTDVSGQTKYPVILHHGLFGRRVGWILCFRGAEERLYRSGYKAFATEIFPEGTVEDRSKRLADFVDEVLFKTGSSRVNIIAHSLGGLEARYLVTALGYHDKVASVTTLGTPHKGLVLGNLPGYVVGDWLIGLVGIGNYFLNQIGENFAVVPLRDMTPSYLKEFNARTPDHPDVFYQSFAGIATIRARGGQGRLNPVFISTNIIGRLQGEDNDGLVSLDSAAWGTVNYTIPVDHMQMVSYIYGSPEPGAFDYLEFLESVSKDLEMLGY